MFPSFHRASVLGAGLDREERDIHHLLAMMMCLLTDKDLNNQCSPLRKEPTLQKLFRSAWPEKKRTCAHEIQGILSSK